MTATAIHPARRRRVHATLAAGLTLGAALCWTVLVLFGSSEPHFFVPHGADPGLAAFAMTVAMWMVMMVAMMTPGVLPWIGLHTKMSDYPGYGSGAAFLAGYFAAWLVYSVAGASLQLTLQEFGALGPDLHVTAAAGGFTLMAAGLFQFSSLKDSCLSRCSNPLSLLLRYWRDGPVGAFSLGLRHGVFCVGCCWALMAVGFALGLMNLLWMAAVTVVIALEQLAPRGRLIGRTAGALMILWGGILLAG